MTQVKEELSAVLPAAGDTESAGHPVASASLQRRHGLGLIASEADARNVNNEPKPASRIAANQQILGEEGIERLARRRIGKAVKPALLSQ